MSQLEKRIEFTQMVSGLLKYAYSIGLDVILDWALRTTEVQKMLYDKGASKCDGMNKKSQHQRGLAVDVYIIEDRKISNRMEDYKKLHEYWSAIGGEPIVWLSPTKPDMGHFEVR